MMLYDLSKKLNFDNYELVVGLKCGYQLINFSPKISNDIYIYAYMCYMLTARIIPKSHYIVYYLILFDRIL